MERKKNYKRFSLYVVLGCLAVMMMIIVSRICIIDSKKNYIDDHVIYEINDGWTAETIEGTFDITLPADIKTAGDKVILTRNFNEDRNLIEGLLFDNFRQSVLVRDNEQEIFEINLTPARRIVMVTTTLLVSFPTSAEKDSIAIEFGDFSNGVCHIDTMLGGPLYAVRSHLHNSEMVTILNIIVLLLFGTILIICVIFFYVKDITDSRFIPVGMFSVITAGWAFSDSSLGSLSNMSLEYIALMSYFTSMLMPIPIVTFVWNTTAKKYKSLRILNTICYANIFIQCILAMTGIYKFHQMLPVCHGLIGLGIIFTLRSLRIELKSDKNKGEIVPVSIGIMVLAAMTVLALTLYWLGIANTYRKLIVTGVSFLFIILGTVLILSYLDQWQENQAKIEELKAYERLSLLDNLTGIGNRRAFERSLKNLESALGEHEDAILVMLDLNGLKFTNDTYGHNMGDQLIADAADCIARAYGDSERCFRIGGDEFTVILQNPVKSGQYYSDKLDDEIEEYNSKSSMKLSIARGWSHILSYTGERITISDWKQEADINMYIDKASRRPKQEVSRTRELQEIIDCIVMALETRDVYTADHSGRVRELSVYIAKKLGLTPETIEQIDMAAHMHDIGKIAVPDNVLLKPGKLTKEEFDLMKRHSVIGGQIIARSDSMYDISQIVLHHHERFDGKGYPDGISKEDIPIGARIIAIADSIDAMTSKRVYRDSLGIDRCREEIENNLGKMYDPAIGSIALDNWQEISDIILKHPRDIIAPQISEKLTLNS